jgi:hypothetical protein
MNEKEWQQKKNPAASGRQTGADSVARTLCPFSFWADDTHKKEQTDDRGEREAK